MKTQQITSVSPIRIVINKNKILKVSMDVVQLAIPLLEDTYMLQFLWKTIHSFLTKLNTSQHTDEQLFS